MGPIPQAGRAIPEVNANPCPEADPIVESSELSIRIWTSLGVPEVRRNALNRMIVDLASASQARAFQRGERLHASIDSAISAIALATRIQRVTTGFCRSLDKQKVAVTIAVHRPEADSRVPGDERSTDQQCLEAWEQAGPAQILLSPAILEKVRHIAGLVIRSHPAGSSVYELVWADHETYDFFADLLRPEKELLGKVDQSPTVAIPRQATESPYAVACALFLMRALQLREAIRAAIKSSAGYLASAKSRIWDRISADRTLGLEEPTFGEKLLASKRIVVTGIALFVIVLITASVLILRAHRSSETRIGAAKSSPRTEVAPSGADQQTNVQKPPSLASPPTSLQSPQKSGAGSAGSADSAPPPKEQRKAAAAVAKLPRNSVAKNCALIDITDALNTAERWRASRKYDDAERMYNEVLACDPNNDRARSGLARTKEAHSLDRSR